MSHIQRWRIQTPIDRLLVARLFQLRQPAGPAAAQRIRPSGTRRPLLVAGQGRRQPSGHLRRNQLDQGQASHHLRHGGLQVQFQLIIYRIHLQQALNNREQHQGKFGWLFGLFSQENFQG